MGCGSSVDVEGALCLPQHDNATDREAREERLRKMCEAFRMERHDGYPNWMADPPIEEILSKRGAVEMWKIFYRLVDANVDIRADVAMAKVTDDPALQRPFGRFEAMFDDDDPIPAVSQTWRTDDEFGYQHLGGLMPQFIEGIDTVPSNFAMDEGDLPLPDGMSLSDLAAAKRLFLSDVCECLEGVEGVDGNVMTVPMILFYLDSRDKLMPLAIALDRAGGRVYTPKKDTPAVWLAAKVHAMCAEYQVHIVLIHFMTQHLLIGAVWATCNQTVSERHPLHRLLEPHMFNTLLTNTNLQASMAEAPDTLGTKGALAANLQAGDLGCIQIMKNNFKNFEWDAHYNYPVRTARRGLSELPNYLHRDDCTALWNAVHTYTKSFCTALYSKPEDLTGDSEVQAWAEALQDPDRGNVRGLPFGEDGRIESVDQLSLFLTEIIFQAAVCHGHVENCALVYYPWVPLYPGACRIPVPIPDDITDEDIDGGLPPEPRAVSQVALIRPADVKIEDVTVPRLGEFTERHLRNAPQGCREALDEFLKNLETIEGEMKERHTARMDPANPVPTTLCLPSRLAQSIWL